ncbi:unnamed protein product [Amoebophrya sp. A25]|nr:unnamed protein product [Amoebophrya sp. A25]|eukprot:GSA25T00008635001.1
MSQTESSRKAPQSQGLDGLCGSVSGVLGELSELDDEGASKQIHYLIDEEKTIMGVKFYGTSWKPWWGDSLCAPFGSQQNQKYGCEIKSADGDAWAEIREKRFGRVHDYDVIPNDVEVVLSHAPVAPTVPQQYADLKLEEDLEPTEGVELENRLSEIPVPQSKAPGRSGMKRML